MEAKERHIETLFRYPVKSMGGEEVSQANVLPTGLEFDRNWMLISMSGKFITQREIPSLSLFSASVQGDNLIIKYRPDNASFHVPIDPHENSETLTCRVWDREVSANIQDTNISQWISEIVGQKLRLVRVCNSAPKRYINPDNNKGSLQKAFWDSKPLLACGTESLHFLNSKLSNPIGWDRFRPNIVFNTSIPFEEDRWRHLDVHADQRLSFHYEKMCSRCVIIATDQNSGQLESEPLKTLSQFRKRNNSNLFGIYLSVDKSGNLIKGQAYKVKKGDEITSL